MHAEPVVDGNYSGSALRHNSEVLLFECLHFMLLYREILYVLLHNIYLRAVVIIWIKILQKTIVIQHNTVLRLN